MLSSVAPLVLTHLAMHEVFALCEAVGWGLTGNAFLQRSDVAWLCARMSLQMRVGVTAQRLSTHMHCRCAECGTRTRCKAVYADGQRRLVCTGCDERLFVTRKDVRALMQSAGLVRRPPLWKMFSLMVAKRRRTGAFCYWKRDIDSALRAALRATCAR